MSNIFLNLQVKRDFCNKIVDSLWPSLGPSSRRGRGVIQGTVTFILSCLGQNSQNSLVTLFVKTLLMLSENCSLAPREGQEPVSPLARLSSVCLKGEATD